MIGTLAVTFSEKEKLEDDSKIFMSKHQIKDMSGEVLSDRSQGFLSKERLKVINELNVEHFTLSENDSKLKIENLSFYDKEKRLVATGRIRYAESAKLAQFVLINDITSGSIPLDLKLSTYIIDSEGPGELCISDNISVDKSNVKVIGKTIVHFIRYNIAISIRSMNEDYNAKNLAKIIDELLTSKKNPKGFQ